MYGAEFASLAIIHFLAVISPGPDFAVVVSQSISHGKRIAIYTAIGIGLGISVHVFYTLIGVGALIHASDRLMMITQVCGALYIGYLGIQLVRTQPRQALSETEAQPLPACTRQALTKGFLTNATNPKATLFFLAIFTTVVSAQTPLWVQVAYGAWMCVINALWFVFVAFFFSNQTIRAQFLRLGHWFERLMGVVLLGFAVKLLVGVAFE